MIEQQIEARWGKSEVKNYDPFHSARTFNSWVKLGFRVKKGEKALRSVTVIETKDEKVDLAPGVQVGEVNLGTAGAVE